MSYNASGLVFEILLGCYGSRTNLLAMSALGRNDEI